MPFGIGGLSRSIWGTMAAGGGVAAVGARNIAKGVMGSPLGRAATYGAGAGALWVSPEMSWTKNVPEYDYKRPH